MLPVFKLLLGKVNLLKRLPLWRPILGYVFITTAVTIGILQVMALPLWPMSKSFYRRVAAFLSHPMLLCKYLYVTVIQHSSTHVYTQLLSALKSLVLFGCVIVEYELIYEYM